MATQISHPAQTPGWVRSAPLLDPQQVAQPLSTDPTTSHSGGWTTFSTLGERLSYKTLSFWSCAINLISHKHKNLFQCHSWSSWDFSSRKICVLPSLMFSLRSSLHVKFEAIVVVFCVLSQCRLVGCCLCFRWIHCLHLLPWRRIQYFPLKR